MEEQSHIDVYPRSLKNLGWIAILGLMGMTAGLIGMYMLAFNFLVAAFFILIAIAVFWLAIATMDSLQPVEFKPLTEEETERIDEFFGN